jgi:hypothetical protein
LKSKKTSIHRGRVLSEAVKQSNFTKEEAAKRARYSRSSYYKHITNPDLPFNILTRYGKAIRYDFRGDIPEMPSYVLEESPDSYKKITSLEEAMAAIEYWKDKYLKLLETMVARGYEKNNPG